MKYVARNVFFVTNRSATAGGGGGWGGALGSGGPEYEILKKHSAD